MKLKEFKKLCPKKKVKWYQWIEVFYKTQKFKWNIKLKQTLNKLKK